MKASIEDISNYLKIQEERVLLRKKPKDPAKKLCDLSIECDFDVKFGHWSERSIPQLIIVHVNSYHTNAFNGLNS